MTGVLLMDDATKDILAAKRKANAEAKWAKRVASSRPLIEEGARNHRRYIRMLAREYFTRKANA